jgi:hypothetical protein
MGRFFSAGAEGGGPDDRFCVFEKGREMGEGNIYSEEPLVERLEWIQENTVSIIPLTINLGEEFGVWRYMIRGATTETLNA